MGVKDLWTVLEPIGEHCTMSDLRGKRLAVDISGWIFQSLQSPMIAKRPIYRPHLRNLFWRLLHLMKHQVRIIVVFDGPTPKLKSVTLAKRAVARRQQREKGQVEEADPVGQDLIALQATEAGALRSTTANGESYFGQYCAECKEMLMAFRIPFVVSSGDAEATCAYLNRIGLVDGCITDDNDAFLFGASVVYRHYTCDKKKLENLRCYRSQSIEEQLGLTQDHLIAMALILGCDYGLAGIKGIGKERALEVLQSWPGYNPLERLSEWRSDVTLAKLAKFDPSNKPDHCRSCGHLGSMPIHNTEGCNGCARQGRACARTNADEWDCNCEWHQQYANFKKKQVEIKIMKAAIEDINFPDKDIIDTYKQAYPDEHPGTFVWTRPCFAELYSCISSLFNWTRDKIREKLFTYYTSFDMLALGTGQMAYEHCSEPEKIIAKRVENGCQMLEVEWKTVPDLPLPEEVTANCLVSREFKEIFSEVFPETVAQFDELLIAKKRKKKVEDGKITEVDSADGEPKTKRGRRKKVVSEEMMDGAAKKHVRKRTPKKLKDNVDSLDKTDAEGLSAAAMLSEVKPPRKRRTRKLDNSTENVDGSEKRISTQKRKIKQDGQSSDIGILFLDQMVKRMEAQKTHNIAGESENAVFTQEIHYRSSEINATNDGIRKENAVCRGSNELEQSEVICITDDDDDIEANEKSSLHIDSGNNESIPFCNINLSRQETPTAIRLQVRTVGFARKLFDSEFE